MGEQTGRCFYCGEDKIEGLVNSNEGIFYHSSCKRIHKLEKFGKTYDSNGNIGTKEYTQCIICNEDKDERLTYDDASRLPHHDSCIANATVLQRDEAIALISERKKELAKEYLITQDELKKVLSEEVQGKGLYTYKDVELSRRVYDKGIGGSLEKPELKITDNIEE